MKKKDNANPDIPSDYIKDLHQAKTIHSICAIIVRHGTLPHPILNSLDSIAPNHQEWSNILEKLNPMATFRLKDTISQGLYRVTVKPIENRDETRSWDFRKVSWSKMA